LLSSVPAVLSLLLKTLSTIVELLANGHRLCHTLLQKKHLELLSRGIAAYKKKDHVISPPLRLIREIVIFDGGSLAKQVFRARDHTLKGLARNLGLRYMGDGVEDRRKPSIRTNALRLFLACIKFLSPPAKTELLGHRDVIAALTRDMRDDPPFLVVEALEILKTHVLQDGELARETKSRFLSATILGRFASLHFYEHEEGERSESEKDIPSLVHEFLLMACTTPSIGILHKQSGFYPRGVDPSGGDILDGNQIFIELGLDSLEWADKFGDCVPVYNTILSEFIQGLRPWSNIKQSELLLGILKAAPELVADYFFGKKSFTFEPNLNSTWIGYSALLFSSIQLPIPPFFGHPDCYAWLPPPTLIIIESILPKPLTQKAITRCLNQNSPLIKFFAIRLLITAFQKLRETLDYYRAASNIASEIWGQAASQLTEEFCQRCPTMRDVINTFRGIGDTDLQQKHAASKLLVFYYEVLPQVALEPRFDVSSILTQALKELEAAPKETEDASMRIINVENLFLVANYSPGMRWFNKAGSLPVSPFTAMLKLSVQASFKVPLLRMRALLNSITIESGIVQSQTQHSALDALTAALSVSKGNSPEPIYEFLDNCVLRCSTSPVKYIDTLDQYCATAYGSIEELSGKRREPVSLLLFAIAEQWSFMSGSSEQEKMAVAIFIASYCAASTKILENKKVITMIIKTLIEGSESLPVINAFEQYPMLIDRISLPIINTPSVARAAESHHHSNKEGIEITADILEVPEDKLDDHSALTKWTSKPVEEVVEEGHAAALAVLLSSDTLSARKEALTNINKLILKLQSSSYSEKDQIWLLLSETLETARSYVGQAPLPTPISAFVSYAINVLQDPLHYLYPKINKFLSQGPCWEVDKIPLLYSILQEPPSIDDGYYLEVGWLLSYLLQSLRTTEDLAIFRRRHVFEKLMSLYVNAYLPSSNKLREKILRVLWRATKIKGGSTTLITRASAVSWLRVQIKADDENMALLEELLGRVLGTCDHEKVEYWSQRSVGDLLC
jgi:nucleolar pre-ribosomal-associated protein 1